MAGAGFDNDVMYALNVDFTGNSTVTGQVTADAQILLGSTSAPFIRVGDIVQPVAGFTVTYSQPTSTTARLTYALADDLAALEALATTGLATRTGTSTWTTRTLTQPAAGITISNADGVAGNPTFALADDLAALEALATTGLATRTGTSTWTTRTLTQPAAGITISNADGVAGNPTFALADDLAALEALATTGLATRTGASTWTTRSLVAPAAGFTITNNDGVSGNPTFALSDDLAAIEALSGTGLATRTAANTWTTRSIAVTASTGLSITNGDGVAGDPTLAGIDATDTVKGVATFDENDFLVTSGDVAIANRVRLTPNRVENLGIAYASGTGTFTVQGADGTALSATNPGYVVIPSKANPGQMVKLPITANQTFIDDAGSSTIIGNLFGLTSGVVAAVDIPFFLYAVMNDSANAVSFMISRVPHAVSAPASAKIGKTGSAVADSQGSFFALGNPTVTDYDTNPCICIGAFRMRMSTANDWTVQTLGNQDGIGRFLNEISFTVPRGHFGAAATKYFLNNGGTAPDDADGGYSYQLSKDGKVLSQIAFPSIDTAGVGAVVARIATPFTVNHGGTNLTGYYLQAATNTLIISGDQVQGTSATSTMRWYQVPGVAVLTNASFTLTSAISAMLDYQADLI